MSVRKLYRVAVPAVTAAFTLAAGIAPTQAASTKGWPIVATVGNPTDGTLMSSVDATSATSAWAAGVDCAAPCTSTPTAGQLLVEQWNGAQWTAAALPTTPNPLSSVLLDSPTIGSSSAANSWVFAVDGSSGAPIAVRGDGQQWTEQTLPSWFFSGSTLGQLKTEVFSPINVWVFSTESLGGTGQGAAKFAAHYNGTTWAKVPLRSTPTAVSAVSASSLWVVALKGAGFAGARASRFGAVGAAGRFATRLAATNNISEVAKHWTRHGWRNIKMPSPYLPKRRLFIPIAAASAGKAALWVSGLVVTSKGNLKGSRLLHWNGHRWSHVAVPVKGIDIFGAMSTDGKGGVWQDLMTLANTPQTALVHFRKGRWTSQLPPKYQGNRSLVAGLAWIPGTSSEWGVGTTSSLNTLPALGVIVKHGK